MWKEYNSAKFAAVAKKIGKEAGSNSMIIFDTFEILYKGPAVAKALERYNKREEKKNSQNKLTK